MATTLEKPLKREILIGKDAYVVILTPGGLKLTVKGRRNGLELSWQDLVNGDAALATALNASLEETTTRLRPKTKTKPAPKTRPRRVPAR